tara:strand:- start:298 stop:777 length:480 start_codon:yes stop_codon:yes gene_type:complete
MNNYKTSKILLFLLTFSFLLSCGYQPLLNKENQKFNIEGFEFEGNRRLGGLLKNNLIITNRKEENNLTLTIKSNKKVSVSNKSETGKILQYAVNVNFNITAVSDLDNKIVLSKVYSRKQNYSASDIHLDTLNSEKKIVESMVESVASQILIELNSIYQE